MSALRVIRRIAICLLAMLTPALFAALPGTQTSNGPNNQNNSGDSAIKSISEIIESAGDFLVNTIRPEAGADPDSPEWDSLNSPRATVLTFIEAMNHVELGRTNAWPRALKTLGDPDLEEVDLQTAALHLKESFNRLGHIRPTDLPGATRVQERDIQRFEVFPFALDHEWVWYELGKAPEGTIVVIRNSENGNWTFSPETVQQASSLRDSLASLPPRYDRYQGGQTFIDVFGPTFKRTPWWGWLVLLGAIVAGTVAGRICRSLIFNIADRLEKRTLELIGGLIRGFGTPVSLLVFTFALIAGLLFIQFTPTLSSLRWDIIKLLLLVATGWLVFELMDLFTIYLRRSMRQSTEFADMAVTLVRRSLRVFIIVIFIIFVLQNMLGLNIAALITGLGLVGLAVSLAGKESAQNLFGALSVFINRPFVVGDWINFKKQIGEVEDVGMQVTRIRLMSGELLVVPNMQFINTQVENLSLRQFLRRELNISITYDTGSEKITKALELLDQILRDDEIASTGHFDLEKRPPKISFDSFGDYYLNLKVYYWYYMHEDRSTPQRRSDRGWYSYLEHCSMVNQRIYREFNEAGIEFAFPTQTLHLPRQPDEQLESKSDDGGKEKREKKGDTKPEN